MALLALSLIIPALYDGSQLLLPVNFEAASVGKENYILLSNWEIKMYFQIIHFTCAVYLVKLVLPHTRILYAKSCERCQEERLTGIVSF